MQDDYVKVWNVAGLDKKKEGEKNVQFLTNNALENYNRHFNIIVPNVHPNFAVFAHALKKEATTVTEHNANVRKGREIAPSYDGAKFIEIPKDFQSFRYKAPPASKKRKTAK